MRDPWKFVAFGLAAVSGYMSSSIATSIATQNYGLPELPGNVLIIAGIGLFTGFLIDELIPAYYEKVRGSSAGAGGDFDAGSGGDDFDFD
ncbi:hypothetical protein [Candidatus Nanohalobium constans]|uniref:Uncharacterized protein n=1 Tax=Candidatus Nanohalobium constans TaxID=2565781 RepID=A0A5Q0UIP4_9ARCH|nr:hypothetical protein [Candidatus Nanohalobium constans]QGA80815.1 hypothetical protein LC1Nh_0933 [Candidatus Nanohalobium constans]